MNMRFLEQIQVLSGFVPVAMNTNPGPIANWISLQDYGRVAFVFFKAIGTAGDDPTLTLLQATDTTGATNKALNINQVDKKQGAAVNAIGQFTTSTPAAPANHDTFSADTWTNSDLAEQQAIVVIEVRAEDLDIDGGFTSVKLNAGDVGTNAQLGCILAFASEPKYANSQLPAAI